jgi:hypothetical protein
MTGVRGILPNSEWYLDILKMAHPSYILLRKTLPAFACPYPLAWQASADTWKFTRASVRPFDKLRVNSALAPARRSFMRSLGRRDERILLGLCRINSCTLAAGPELQ